MSTPNRILLTISYLRILDILYNNSVLTSFTNVLDIHESQITVLTISIICDR